jgi:UDP-glucose 4-epimerase
VAVTYQPEILPLGYSVKDVMEICGKVTNHKAVIECTDRRSDDPACLSDWKAEYSLG